MHRRSGNWQPGYEWASRLSRAYTQRIYLMPGAARKASDGEYRFEVMGSTRTVYNVTVEQVGGVFCSCPDHSVNRKFCKHLMLLLIRVLHMPAEEVHADYSSAAEDDDFAASARTLEYCERYFETMASMQQRLAQEEAEKRKPIEEDDDCPICYERFADTAAEGTVWCRASCGKSVHAECFGKWAARDVSRAPRCVYCRATWKLD